MSLELYLEQLAEDMRASALQARQKSKSKVKSGSRENDFQKHINEVENYLFGDRQPLSQIVGIDKDQLPPPEKLNESQQQELFKEMESLLEAYNFFADFPGNLPGHLRYKVMREHWEKEQTCLSMGQSHLEFCQYEPEECPFPKKYCRCMNY